MSRDPTPAKPYVERIIVMALDSTLPSLIGCATTIVCAPVPKALRTGEGNRRARCSRLILLRRERSCYNQLGGKVYPHLSLSSVSAFITLWNRQIQVLILNYPIATVLHHPRTSHTPQLFEQPPHCTARGWVVHRLVQVLVNAAESRS